jgi:hypothetical protein
MSVTHLLSEQKRLIERLLKKHRRGDSQSASVSQ